MIKFLIQWQDVLQAIHILPSVYHGGWLSRGPSEKRPFHKKWATMETFRCDVAITADLQVLLAFNILLHVKWPDFEPFLRNSAVMLQLNNAWTIGIKACKLVRIIKKPSHKFSEIRPILLYCCSTQNNQSDHNSIHKTKERTTLCGTALNEFLFIRLYIEPPWIRNQLIDLTIFIESGRFALESLQFCRNKNCYSGCNKWTSCEASLIGRHSSFPGKDNHH